MTDTINQKLKIVGTRYVLAVKDLKKSSEYYKNQLGFTTVWDGEGWHFLEREKFIVMLGECPDEKAALEIGDHSYFAYIDIENIDFLYEEFLLKKVEILSKIENKPWGQREFSIRTIDGHRITFGEKIKAIP
jgi:catechol 2,3-dioxygenase-like lactoylglutathione lyase family enzyme